MQNRDSEWYCNYKTANMKPPTASQKPPKTIPNHLEISQNDPKPHRITSHYLTLPYSINQ